MLDCANPLYGSNYAFGDIYLLVAAAEDKVNTKDIISKNTEKVTFL